MCTIYREIDLEVDARAVWAALRDFGAVQERPVPGFVTRCELDGGNRVVTFFMGSSRASG
jgi:hypothetical protein